MNSCKVIYSPRFRQRVRIGKALHAVVTYAKRLHRFFRNLNETRSWRCVLCLELETVTEKQVVGIKLVRPAAFETVCNRCSQILELCEHDPKLLESAAQYLQELKAAMAGR